MTKKESENVYHAIDIPRARFIRLTKLKADMGVRTWAGFYERLVDLYENHRIILDDDSD